MGGLDGRTFTQRFDRSRTSRVRGGLLAAALLTIALICCLFGPVAPASAAPPPGSGQALQALLLFQQAELTAGDGAAHDFLGWSVALSGDTALVGAPYHTGSKEFQAGAAFVFVRSSGTWTQQAELTAADGATGDSFGMSVALSGDTALVGALDHSTAGKTDAGAAYVFVRSGTTWTQQVELTATDGAAQDAFGFSVALSGDTALVGSYQHDTAGKQYAGAAYVFVRSGTTWTQQVELTATDGAAQDSFGFSVALSGDTALVGAPSHTGSKEIQAGAAYLFVRSGTTWTQQAELTAADGATADAFGFSVALSGDTVLVSAVNHSTAGKEDAGAAYVYAPDVTAPTTTVSGVPAGWSKTALSVTLSASDGLSGVAITQYRLQGASDWTTYTAPFQVTAQGSSTYEYRSTDVAGNVEDTKAFTVRVDTTPPDTANDVHSPGYNHDVTVTLTPVDELSGVAQTSYSLDGGPWTVGTSLLVLAPTDHSNDGVHTISYYSEDNAGNSEPVKTCALLIDTRPPTPTAPAAAVAQRLGTAVLKYDIHDSGPNAGKANVTIKIKNLHGKTVKIAKLRNREVNQLLRYRFRCRLAKGTYRFCVYARDAAGNLQSRVAHNKLVVK